MKAVILAAGLGTRMKGKLPKPLVKVAGLEIILRTMKLLSQYVEEFVIVVGKNGDKIDDFLKDKKFKYKLVWNFNPERGNGYSFYLSKKFVDDKKFILVMGDHVYDEEFINESIKGFGLIVDKNPLYVSIDEATKVRCENGKVVDIGKNLKDFDYVDTGFFILSPSIYSAAEELVKNKDVVELSEIVKKVKLPVTEVSSHFWMDIDTKEDVKKAKKIIIKKSVKGTGDGFVSKFLNRKISTRISELLVDVVTPNQMTVVSFLIGVLSSATLFFNIAIGALIYQFSSIVDGCDGEIARASLRKSRIGEYVDSILDRIVDFLFLVTLAYVSSFSNFMWVVLSFALFGNVMISYSTEKYKAAFVENIYEKISAMKYLVGKRDERVFVIMLLCIFGLVKELVLILAIWTNLRVLLTMFLVLRFKRNDSG